MCHIWFSIPWHLGFGINSKVFDMETDFEVVCIPFTCTVESEVIEITNIYKVPRCLIYKLTIYRLVQVG